MPRTSGLDAYGGITLSAIYAAARVCRLCEIENAIRLKWVVAALPFLAFATGIGLNDYNSPFAFAQAAAWFLLCIKAMPGKKVGGIFAFLAPSMFSVYLIHTNETGAKFIRWTIEWFDGFWGISAASVLATAIAVFVLGTALDMPRRIAIRMIAAARRQGSR